MSLTDLYHLVWIITACIIALSAVTLTAVKIVRLVQDPGCDDSL